MWTRNIFFFTFQISQNPKQPLKIWNFVWKEPTRGSNSSRRSSLRSKVVCCTLVSFRLPACNNAALKPVLRLHHLFPGVHTSDILTVYISAIKALRELDPSMVILQVACQPIRKYLRWENSSSVFIHSYETEVFDLILICVHFDDYSLLTLIKPVKNNSKQKTQQRFEAKEAIKQADRATNLMLSLQLNQLFRGVFQDSRRHCEADCSWPDRRRWGLHGPGVWAVPRWPGNSGDAGQRWRRQRPRGLDPRPNWRRPWCVNAPSFLLMFIFRWFVHILLIIWFCFPLR